MPELPEVETIARQLATRLERRVVTALATSGKPLRQSRPFDRAAIERGVIGAAVERVHRRGKYLLLDFSSNQVLVVHLGMSGRLEIVPATAPQRPHTHCVFMLADGKEELRFVDPRRFGFIAIHAKAELPAAPELASLGPDPLVEPGFTPEDLSARLESTRGCSIKAFLLDQTQIAGIGNIYASEILFEAGIDPRTEAASVKARRARRLHHAVKEVLARAVANRGTTFRDYVDSWGSSGNNQEVLKVFLRRGLPCTRCGARIAKIEQNARSTFFCPRCQR